MKLALLLCLISAAAFGQVKEKSLTPPTTKESDKELDSILFNYEPKFYNIPGCYCILGQEPQQRPMSSSPYQWIPNNNRIYLDKTDTIDFDLLKLKIIIIDSTQTKKKKNVIL